jgi:DNA-binding response OmpR family regulator
MPTEESPQPTPKQTILHICKREVLRPLRDEILRLSGFSIDSTCLREEAMTMYRVHPFDLVLIDVEGEEGIPMAETLCAEIKTEHPEQLVAFVCNWRVAILTDCPDHILRTEFDPAAFVAGVKEMLAGG